MDRAVVIRESLKLELHALLLRDQLVGPAPIGFCRNPACPTCS